MRKPIGDQASVWRRRWAIEPCTFSRLAFSVLTRRSSGARLAMAVASATRIVAKSLRQIVIEPFRIIAGDVRRRGVKRPPDKRRALGVAERLPARSGRRRTAPRWYRRSMLRSSLSMPSRRAAAYPRP